MLLSSATSECILPRRETALAGFAQHAVDHLVSGGQPGWLAERLIGLDQRANVPIVEPFEQRNLCPALAPCRFATN